MQWVRLSKKQLKYYVNCDPAQHRGLVLILKRAGTKSIHSAWLGLDQTHSQLSVFQTEYHPHSSGRFGLPSQRSVSPISRK